MSNFTKKLAKIRGAKLNRVAEEVMDEKAQAYTEKMNAWGVTDFVLKPATKEEAWTSIILLVKSPQGQAWIENTLMMEDNKAAAITMLLDKLREINNEFADFGSYFSQVSEAKLKEYEMIILPKAGYKGMTGGQAIATWLYGAMNTFYGDGVIYTAELEGEELEKMAKRLTVAFENNVRKTLANLSKKAAAYDLPDHIYAMVAALIEEKAKEAATEIQFDFEEGIVDQIIFDYLETGAHQVTNSMTVQEIEVSVDAAIENWKKDTKENHM